MHVQCANWTRNSERTVAMMYVCTPSSVGYSLVGSACDPAASCIAVRDLGLTSAFTIAHEIGHR